MLDRRSAFGSRVQTPRGPRKSGMPDSVEMPAPVSATIDVAASTQLETASMRLLTMNIIRYAVASLLLTVAVTGQDRPAFEVASIRPTAPDQNEVVVGV